MMKLFAAIFLIGITFTSCAQHKTKPYTTPNKEINNNSMNPNHNNLDTATFANGCFWCTEAIFQQLKGVINVQSGYTGGTVAQPTYKEVCSGTTGHAEALEIIYDSSVIGFDELLEVYWKTHDPTTLNRQGNDVGTQYRSVIFYHNQTQQQLAQNYKDALDKSGAFAQPIVTSIEPAQTFYVAENYHQNYYNQNGSNPYCQMVVRPKLEKFKKVFSAKLKN